jgi:5-methylcytosine-specific restriction endonuclease McrA
MSNGKRDYKKEKRLYEDKHPERMKDRVARNKARREAIREGKVKKGDGKQIDHITPLSEGGSNHKSNLRVVSAKENLAKEAKRKKRNS